jgi:Ca2+-binding RTX toxin-like protein
VPAIPEPQELTIDGAIVHIPNGATVTIFGSNNVIVSDGGQIKVVGDGNEISASVAVTIEVDGSGNIVSAPTGSTIIVDGNANDVDISFIDDGSTRTVTSADEVVEGGSLFVTGDGNELRTNLAVRVVAGGNNNLIRTGAAADLVALRWGSGNRIVTGSGADSVVLGSLPAPTSQALRLAVSIFDEMFVRPQSDSLRGNVIRTGWGNDVIYGGRAGDLIRSGGKSDFVFGRAGDDQIFGGAGRDVLRGGRGDDSILGGKGDDRAVGGDGDDVLRGGPGSDYLIGGAGYDECIGGIRGRNRFQGCDERS